MRERSIIFNTDMVKAILEDRMIQTRRLTKLHEYNKEPDKWNIRPGVNCQFADSIERNKYNLPSQQIYIKCPYGLVGDRLWVQETWGLHFAWDGIRPSDIPPSKLQQSYYRASAVYAEDVHKWRLSTHMPRWASRIDLESIEIRVERLQDISEDDAKAEGVNPYLLDKLKGGTKYKMLKTYHHEFWPLIDHADEGEEVVFECPNMGFARLRHTQWQEGNDPIFRIPAQEVFNYVGALEPDYNNGMRILWDSLNAKRGYGWSINPWVWVIEFKQTGEG